MAAAPVYVKILRARGSRAGDGRKEQDCRRKRASKDEPIQVNLHEVS
jgi:hypothetical protein